MESMPRGPCGLVKEGGRSQKLRFDTWRDRVDGFAQGHWR
jgi:hypothetical protein